MRSACHLRAAGQNKQGEASPEEERWLETSLTLVDVAVSAHKGSYGVQIFLFFVDLVLLFDPAPASYFLDVRDFFVLSPDVETLSIRDVDAGN